MIKPPTVVARMPSTSQTLQRQRDRMLSQYQQPPAATPPAHPPINAGLQARTQQTQRPLAPSPTFQQPQRAQLGPQMNQQRGLPPPASSGSAPWQGSSHAPTTGRMGQNYHLAGQGTWEQLGHDGQTAPGFAAPTAFQIHQQQRGLPGSGFGQTNPYANRGRDQSFTPYTGLPERPHAPTLMTGQQDSVLGRSAEGLGEQMALANLQAMRYQRMGQNFNHSQPPVGGSSGGVGTSSQGLTAGGGTLPPPEGHAVDDGEQQASSGPSEYVSNVAESTGARTEGIEAVMAAGYDVDQEGNVYTRGEDGERDHHIGVLHFDEEGNLEGVKKVGEGLGQGGFGEYDPEEGDPILEAAGLYRSAGDRKAAEAAEAEKAKAAEHDAQLQRFLEQINQPAPKVVDDATVDAAVQAERRRSAYESAQAMKAALDAAANAGANPAYGAAAGADMSQKASIASQQNEAQMRMQAMGQNAQAMMKQYESKIGYLMMLANFAQDNVTRDKAFAQAQQLQREQAVIAKEQARLNFELQNTITPAAALGAGAQVVGGGLGMLGGMLFG